MNGTSFAKLLALCTLFPATLSAQELSVDERESLLERLDELRSAVQEEREGRYVRSLNAFREVMGSNREAVNLYEDCVELVDFKEQNRSGEEFRIWRAKFDTDTNTEKFGTMLRFQLRWLVLTMQAHRLDRPEALAPEVLALLRDIFAASEVMDELLPKLSQSVNQSAFARAYGLNEIEVEGWPNSPLPLQFVYENLILPQLREGGDRELLRTVWQERIGFEGQLVVAGIDGERFNPIEESPAWRSFSERRRPELRWRMEVDLFALGDQREAAVNLLQHLRANIDHPAAENWEEEFRSLVGSSTGEGESHLTAE